MTLKQRIALLIAAVVSMSGMVLTAAHADDDRQETTLQNLKDRDCSDFPSQRLAQLYYLSIGGPAIDPDNLDSNGDGIACESLPCPCYYGSQPTQQPSPSATPTPTPKPEPVKVKAIIVKVLDGEKVTVKLLPSRQQVGVQVLGLNAPQLTACGGPESRASMSKLLPEGLQVWLFRDPSQADRTSNGRLLRYVNKASNMKDSGRVQLVRGWALPQRYSKSFQRESDYRAKATSARQAQRGLWGQC